MCLNTYTKQPIRFSDRLELGSISSSTYLDSYQDWVWIKVIYSQALWEVVTKKLEFKPNLYKKLNGILV